MTHTQPQATAELKQLATLFGIQTQYLDDRGRRQCASQESLASVFKAFGIPAATPREIQNSLRETLLDRVREPIPPVVAVWNQATPRIQVRLPESASKGNLSATLQFESGERLQTDIALNRQRTRTVEEIEGVRYITKTVSLPRSLPTGYHTLTVETPAGKSQTHLLSAPTKTFSEKRTKRAWGVFAPLYALHSERSWGGGDFGDLRAFANWISDLGGDVVATLPLLPAFLGKPCEPSPYSPVSRLFWNEFYIEVERIPELTACREARRLIDSNRFQQQIQSLRQSDVVDYFNQMAAKRRVIEVLARFFFSKPSPRRTAFNRHIRSHPAWDSYARFRAVFEKNGKAWPNWPAAMRTGELRDGEFDPAIRNYYLYAQWLAREQMEALSTETRGRGLKLYLDMPLGVHSDGYDAWKEQSLFALNASGGAPPDSVFTKGQDWGFAPIHPGKSREQGHRYIIQYLRHHLEHAGMLRIDHVMGLHRLYWVPRGVPASHGAYVSYPAEELYAVLSIESHKHRATIVGENLGTVPPEVNKSLSRHGIREMFVSQYEVKPHPHTAFRRIPKMSVASLNTHDMPTFQAFLQGLDIMDRHDLGLLNQADLNREQRLRNRIRRSFIKLLLPAGSFKETSQHVEGLLRASLAHLSASSTELVLVNLEDLWREVQSQNVPGTTCERVNWRRKARLSIDQLSHDPGVRQFLGIVHSARNRDRKS